MTESSVYVRASDSDDRLTQAEWHLYVADIKSVLRMFSLRLSGSWYSLPDDPCRSACWCAEFEDEDRKRSAKAELGRLVVRFRHDSILWSEVSVTEAISGITG